MRATLFRDKLASVLKGQSQLMAIVSNMQTLNGYAKTKLNVLAINWEKVQKIDQVVQQFGHSNQQFKRAQN